MGAIIGSKNASKERLFEAAIKRACLAENGRKLRSIAEKLTDMAVEGDIQAIKETLDRVDGKSKQPIIGGDPDDAPILIQRIERVIVENTPDKNG